MIRWGESRRRQDPGFFCRLATRGAEQPLWVGVALPVEARAFHAEAFSDVIFHPTYINTPYKTLSMTLRLENP